MKDVEIFNSQVVQTLTSLQIAEVTNKHHRHIIRDVKCLIDKMPEYSPNLGSTKNSEYQIDESEYIASNGKRNFMYILNKKACLLLASGYDVTLRAAIIDRWEELEREKMYGGFKIPQTYSEALKLAATQSEEIEQQRKTLVLQAPKVLFASAVETSHSSCLVGELAKILCQNGVEIGQNRLFEWLRDNNYLCTKGESHNIPTQRAMEQGLFEIKKRTINNPDGSSIVKSTPKVTGKGLIYFVNKFLGKE
ncbi:Phage antirepressor protein [Mucinivorans hirudinis]|uniref:Phage antirepressor protein n=1 Tax=Mucinivorans hirudinis TaxID=1433126 RepID=A0A060RDI7_9BACT|nr:Phage antirepressor protein [Mucinivorans hirudinis]